MRLWFRRIEILYECFSIPGFLFCLLSLFCGLMMAYFDKRSARILKKEDAKTGMFFVVTLLLPRKTILYMFCFELLLEFNLVGLAMVLGEVIRITDVKDFPLSVWLIFIICVTYYVSVFPFISLGLWVSSLVSYYRQWIVVIHFTFSEWKLE